MQKKRRSFPLLSRKLSSRPKEQKTKAVTLKTRKTVFLKRQPQKTKIVCVEKNRKHFVSKKFMMRKTLMLAKKTKGVCASTFGSIKYLVLYDTRTRVLLCLRPCNQVWKYASTTRSKSHIKVMKVDASE